MDGFKDSMHGCIMYLTDKSRFLHDLVIRCHRSMCAADVQDQVKYMITRSMIQGTCLRVHTDSISLDWPSSHGCGHHKYAVPTTIFVWQKAQATFSTAALTPPTQWVIIQQSHNYIYLVCACPLHLVLLSIKPCDVYYILQAARACMATSSLKDTGHARWL